MPKKEDRTISKMTYTTQEFIEKLGLEGSIRYITNSISDDTITIEIEQGN